MKSEKLAITGMSCENCVGHVTSALENLDGLSNIIVNLESNTAEFDYNPNHLTIEKIIAAIDEEGYGAELITGG